jgi:hypothetical protein
MEAEGQRVAELVSAFDVDGPCVVVALIDSNWDMLPQPVFRSLSVCWVVDEHVEDTESKKA